MGLAGRKRLADDDPFHFIEGNLVIAPILSVED
jgi:hypothetical protein